MTRLRVTHTATGRSMIGTPDELLDFLGSWWPQEDSDARGCGNRRTVSRTADPAHPLHLITVRGLG